MAALPEQIIVGPYVYRVEIGGDEWDQAVAKHAEEHPEQRLLGCCDNNAGFIGLDPALPLPMLRETLLHEVLHACFFYSGSAVTGEEDAECEESAVSLTSPHLLVVLRDNPDLVVFLLDSATRHAA